MVVLITNIIDIIVIVIQLVKVTPTVGGVTPAQLYSVVECRSLVKTLVSGVKTITWGLSSCKAPNMGRLRMGGDCSDYDSDYDNNDNDNMMGSMIM